MAGQADDPFAPPSHGLGPSDDTEGDALVAASIEQRARASAFGGLGLGLLAAAAGAVPATGAPLPLMAYAIFAGGPAVVGAVAVAAGLSAMRALVHPDPHIGALLSGSRPLVFVVAGAAIAFGGLGAALGGLAFLLGGGGVAP